MSIHFSNVFISYFCRSDISNKNLKSQEMFCKNTLNAFTLLIEIFECIKYRFLLFTVFIDRIIIFMMYEDFKL